MFNEQILTNELFNLQSKAKKLLQLPNGRCHENIFGVEANVAEETFKSILRHF